MANVPTLHSAADLTQSQAAGDISHLVPSGSILTFAGSAAPTGWLVCDGASLSTSAYASLFAVIGYTFGGSGGSFNLPDLRGRFVRYDDNMGNHGIAGVTAAAAASRDSGRAHGSAQGQATAKNGLSVTNNAVTTTATNTDHTHSGTTNASNVPSSNQAEGSNATALSGAANNAINPQANSGSHSHSFTTGGVSANATHAHNVTSNVVLNGGDAETRPINIALNAIIKI